MLLERAGLALDATPDALGGRTLGEELLTPTRIYALDCLALAAECGAHAFAHITGGGLAGNLARVLPAGARGARRPRDVGAAAGVRAGPRAPATCPRADLEQTFNLGVGMVAVLPADRRDDALDLLAARGVPAWMLGEVPSRPRRGAANRRGRSARR